MAATKACAKRVWGTDDLKDETIPQLRKGCRWLGEAIAITRCECIRMGGVDL